MSGSTIGGVIGGAIGFYVGGPAGAQWGWMIGSAVGGYVDPEQIYGPRLQDASVQTAIPGVFITRGWGVFLTHGFILWQEPKVQEHERTQTQGKGGPENVSFYYTRSHAIGICRGPVSGILMAKENGKIVLDQRTDAEITAELEATGMTPAEVRDTIRQRRAENAKFLRNTTFYLGTEDQLADPVMEEHEGVDNVPAYPGLVYMVRESPELAQGAVSQYEFVVVRDGVSEPFTIQEYGATGYSYFGGNGDSFPLLDDPETEYAAFQANLNGVGSATFDTLSEALEWADANDGRGDSPQYLVGYKGDSAGPWSLTAEPMIGHGSTQNLGNNHKIWMCYQWVEPSVYDDDVWIVGGVNTLTHFTGVDGHWRCDSRGTVYRFTSSTTVEYILPLAILVTDKHLEPHDGPLPWEFPIPDAPGYVVSQTGIVRQLTTFGPAESGAFRALASEVIEGDGMVYTRRELGPVLPAADSLNTEEYWDAAYANAVASGLLPSGMTSSMSDVCESWLPMTNAL